MQYFYQLSVSSLKIRALIFMVFSFLGRVAIHRRWVCINLTRWSILPAALSCNMQSVLFFKQTWYVSQLESECFQDQDENSSIGWPSAVGYSLHAQQQRFIYICCPMLFSMESQGESWKMIPLKIHSNLGESSQCMTCKNYKRWGRISFKTPFSPLPAPPTRGWIAECFGAGNLGSDTHSHDLADLVEVTWPVSTPSSPYIREDNNSVPQSWGSLKG